MNTQISWFCYEAVRDGLLDGETCRQLGRVLGPDADLLAFAQAVVDHALTEDFDKVQELADRAVDRDPGDGPPPLDIFSVGEEKEEAEEAEEAEEVGPSLIFGADDGEDMPVLEFNFDIDAEPDAEPEEEAAVPEPAPEVRQAPVALPPPEPPRRPRQAPLDASLPDLTDLHGLTASAAADLMLQLLTACRQLQASDLHLSAGARPFIRSRREMQYLTEAPLEDAAAELLNTALLDPDQQARFDRKPDLDYALELDDGGRYRVNLMRHKEGTAGTYRVIPDKLRSLGELGFDNEKTIKKFLTHHNGLILVTGPLGAGKTSTLAALIDTINRQRKEHVITVEDPIEVMQDSLLCNVTQREVGKDTDTFHAALKAALREDPDIVVIGELRDLETIEMAITAAETGHLVIGTLHTRDASTTLGRLLDVFPPSQQQQIRSMTAESLRGIICQRLLPGTNGDLVLASEVLVNTIAVASCIRDNKMHQLRSIMQTGSGQGMRTMDDSLLLLCEKGRISQETALANVTDSATANRIKAPKPAPAPGGAPSASDATKKKSWFR